jgi:hypothetical protein
MSKQISKHHKLKLSKTIYSGGLRIIECEECDYAFAIEVDRDNILQMHTRVKINGGDFTASHSYFQIPEIRPTLIVSSEIP